MMDTYVAVKWVHVVSSTILFGFGIATAYYMWMAHLSGDARTIARVAKMVVRADWMFTGTSGIIQPVSGIALATMAGYELTTPWLIVSYALYALAFACWAPVVWLQMRAGQLAEAATRESRELGADYRCVMRWWFALGWPAFLGLLAIFWLMIAKPPLWR